MTKKQLNEYRAKAEACAAGFTVKVNSVEETMFIINHLMYLINGCKEDNERAEEIYSEAMKYNSANAQISHITIQRWGEIGTLLTLVRDEEMTDITSEDGVIAYVYNCNYPDCSELGYVFFEEQNGKLRRVA